MGHNPSNRDAKPGTRNAILETRSADEIIKAIRGNIVAHLSITPNDIAFLMAQYDSASTTAAHLAAANAEAQSKVEFLAAAAVTLGEDTTRLTAEVAELLGLNAKAAALLTDAAQSYEIPTQDETPVYDVVTGQTQARAEYDADHGGDA